jgi:P-type Mg2+ transporter
MTSQPRRGQRWLAWLAWLGGLALLATVVLIARQRSEAMEFARLVRQAAPAWLIVAALLQVGTYAMQAEAWRVFLDQAGARCPFGSLLRLSIAKLFVDQAIPSAGMSGTAVLVKGLENRGVASGTLMAGVVFETVAYYVGYSACMLAAIALTLAGGHPSIPVLVASGLVVLATSGMVLAMDRLARGLRLPRVLERIPGLGSIRRSVQKARSGLLRDRALLARVTVWQIGIHVLDALTIWVLLLALGVSASPLGVFASFMLASLARTVGIVPGGLGTFEAVSVATLRAVGVSLGAALAATLLFRGFSFWLPMLPGWWLARAETAKRR